MQGKAKRIAPADRQRLYLAMDARAGAGAADALRLRALVVLAHGAALTLTEVLSIPLRSVVDVESRRRWDVTDPHVLLEGRIVAVPLTARAPLRAWVATLVRDYHPTWPPARTTPLFCTLEGKGRLLPWLPRTVQRHFTELQRAAQLAADYRFSDLRFDALMAFGEKTRDPKLVAAFGRLRDARQVDRYLPARAASTAELARLAER